MKLDKVPATSVVLILFREYALDQVLQTHTLLAHALHFLYGHLCLPDLAYKVVVCMPHVRYA
jgi:AAA+ superfamily predicted ATPase